jgi:hypothetical protein
MPDPIRILGAIAAAAVTAAAVVSLLRWLRWQSPTVAACGLIAGAGLGYAAGCAWLGVKPHWPPREDQDRLLLVLLPAMLLTEVLAIMFGKIAWMLRAALAAVAGWILLYGSVYLTDLAGPGSREWSPLQAGLILFGLAAGLFVVGQLLRALARRSPRRAVPLALAAVCGGAAVTIMLSGYASGGMLGLPLAAAVGGAWLAALLTAAPGDDVSLVSVSVVGLFALLVIGRFFGELTTAHALILFLAPLACWLPELPPVRRLPAWLCGASQIMLTVIPVAVVLVLAQQKFVAESAPPSAAGEDGSAADYMSFGQ